MIEITFCWLAGIHFRNVWIKTFFFNMRKMQFNCFKNLRVFNLYVLFGIFPFTLLWFWDLIWPRLFFVSANVMVFGAKYYFDKNSSFLHFHCVHGCCAPLTSIRMGFFIAMPRHHYNYWCFSPLGRGTICYFFMLIVSCSAKINTRYNLLLYFTELHIKAINCFLNLMG